MKKIFSLILIFCFCCCFAEAKKPQRDLNSVIKNSKLPKSSITISVRSLKNGTPVYSLNEKTLMHPASVQKMLTIVPIVEELGEDYNLTTAIYSRGNAANGKYLIKLGADPYLKSSDLKTLVSKINPETAKKIYIDESIIEAKDWGEGWQWDDDLNPLMPRFNSYNLDGNISKITIMPATDDKNTVIINPNKYPFVFFNEVKSGDENNVTISRDNSVSSNTLKLEGTVKTSVTRYIPNNNLKRYFALKLTNELENKKIYLKEAYSVSKQNSSDKKLAEVTHPMDKAVEDILKNSNNMAIETLAKLAGGKYYKKTGTDIDGVNLFYKYCDKNGLTKSEIKITDASGVSKNNLVNADFVSEFLVKNQENQTLEKLPHPGEGTLSRRMLPIKDNLRAKTGTLSDISSIAGYLTSKKGNKYAFCIMINDPSSTASEKKNFENYFIREMYMSL